AVLPPLHAVIAAGHAATFAFLQACAHPGSFKRLVLIAPTWRGPLPTMMNGRRPLFDRICRRTSPEGDDRTISLDRTHKVQPGDYVLIHAAAGGMGHILCPWARHLGATVIGTVSIDAKAEIARNLGCHHVINYSTEDFVAVTRKITDGKGVDVVYESIGKDTLQRSLDCLRLVGMCAAYGQASGVPDPIDLVKDLGVRGSLIITRPALSHYLSNRSEIDAAEKSSWTPSITSPRCWHSTSFSRAAERTKKF